MNKQASAQELYDKIASEAFGYGYAMEMDALEKEAAAVPGAKTMWTGIKEMFAAGKGHVKTFAGDPGAAFGAQSWKAYAKKPEVKDMLHGIRDKANTGVPKDVLNAEGQAFRSMGMDDINRNRSALKGLGIVAGGTAVAGIGGAAAINSLTPARKVRVV